MKQIFKNIIALVAITSALISCSSDDDNSSDTPDSNYEQYGEIFTAMPEKEDAVIYQVNIGSFSQEGTLAGVTANLSHIKNLGANVVYLMPIYPIGQVNSVGSPYCISSFTSVNPDFGTLEDLRTLVDTAHAMDMAVILDWVGNHTSWDHPWITEHPEWYQQDNSGNIIPPPNTTYTDVAQLNYTSNDLKDAVTEAMEYWIYNANIDGFRCDYADAMSHSYWTAATPILRAVKDQTILMLAEGSDTDHFDEGFDYTFGFNFYGTLKSAFQNGNGATSIDNASVSSYASLGDTDRIVRYTTNHDVNLSDGTPVNLFGGTNGATAAFVIAAYLKSTPFIYNGQEVAYNQQLSYFYKDPIDWSQANYDVYAEYQDIIAFRNSSEALKTGEFTGYSSNTVCAFTMVKDTETVLVLTNVSGNTTTYNVPSELQSTSWYNAFTDSAYTMNSTITLEGHQYIVLRN